MSILLLRGYILSFVFMCFNFLNKYLSRKVIGLPPYIVVACRFAIMFCLLFPILISPKSDKILESKNIRLQIMRALITFSVLILTYTGYRNLPLGIAAAISTSEPIFVALWSFILRKENKESATYLIPMVLLGFAGMFLIHSQNLVGMSITFNQMIGFVSLIMANVICSGGHYLLAKLGKIDRSSTTIAYNILFNNAFMLLLTTVIGASGGTFDIKWIKPNIFTIALLGVSAWINSWIMLETFKYIDPNTNSSIQNLILPLSMLVSYFVEHEAITSMQLIGIFAIFLSTLLLTYRKFNINKMDIRYEIKKPRLMQYIKISYLAVGIALVGEGIARRFHKTHEHEHKHEHGPHCKHNHGNQDHDHTLCG